MEIITQYNINKKPLYRKYLRENSNWYKTLTRNPDSLKQFEKELKEKYELRSIDKIDKTITLINTLEAIINTIK